jgi:uncharacterized membrane protein HdeD (DUF308 family)
MNPKPILMLVGLVLVFFGLVWLLQGIRILSATFMAGSQFWAATGFLTMIVGLLILMGSMRFHQKKQ